MTDTTVALKRSLSLPLLVLYGMGTILGAGIYVLAGKVAVESGVYTPHAFILAGIIVSFSAHSYAQLSKHFPASAGEAVYVHETFRLNWLAALVGWGIMFTGIVSSATIAKGFAAYMAPFLPLGEALTITVLIIVLSGLAIWGVTQAVWFAGILTAIEVLGIVIVIFFGAPHWRELVDNNPHILSWPSTQSFTAIGFGAFLAFYAFIGFEDIVNMAEEVKTPRRNVPRAIYFSLVATTILYCIVTISLMALLPLDEFVDSNAPFADVARHQVGLSLGLITFISVAAITNGALIQIIMASRVMYGMAKRELAPLALAQVWPRTKTPVTATLIIAVLVLIFALALPITSLAKTTSAVMLCIFALVNASLFILYWRQSSAPGKLRYNLIAPGLGATLCLSFLCLQLWNL